tara:strand:- start:12441 stop:13184 length:744 start_codon:yes stop_codon:yes gene_type:complete
LAKKQLFTVRERLLLERLVENKVMTRNQIHQAIFPSVGKKSLSHYLKRLLNVGFITDKMQKRISRSDIFYELTDSGLAYAMNTIEVEFIQKPTHSYTFEHDVGLVDIRNRFAKSLMLEEYFTENMLQCFGHLHSDVRLKPLIDMKSDAAAFLKVNEKLKTVAIEYEPTKKWIDRYRDKILYYYVNTGIDFVFYICRDESTVRAIQQIERELHPEGHSKMYFILFQDVRSLAESMTLVNRNQVKFEIK